MRHRVSPGVRRARRRASAAARVEEACADATSTAELVEGLRDPFNAALGLSGMIVGSTDPVTAVVSTATRVENLPHAMAVPWMHNEVLEEDFNKFAELHRAAAGATTLHRASQGQPRLSPRYRLNLRMGLGPEMRATFSRDDACWGVASLVREAEDPDGDEEDLAWVEQLRPHVAAGLRRTMAVDVGSTEDRIPGVVALDADGRVQSMTAGAKDLLMDLWMCPVEGLEYDMPGEAYMVATIARAQGLGQAPSRAARTRLRGRSGAWITVRGDPTFTGDGKLAGVVLVIERSRPAEILPILIASYGLTAREREVLSEMTSGRATGEIAARLFISEHTVRDHVKSILAKSATNSRGELMSLLLHHRA